MGRGEAATEIELGEDFWRHARVVVPPGKTSVHLRHQIARPARNPLAPAR
jgi:hypothetical protein